MFLKKEKKEGGKESRGKSECVSVCVCFNKRKK